MGDLSFIERRRGAIVLDDGRLCLPYVILGHAPSEEDVQLRWPNSEIILALFLLLVDWRGYADGDDGDDDGVVE